MRFNFIVHGMMWIEESGPDILLLIPEIREHVVRQGQPDNTQPGLGLQTLLPRENWRTSLAAGSGKPLSLLVPAQFQLHLRKSRIESLHSQARNVYRLPKPDRIRFFRAAEVDATLFGQTPADTALGIPSVSHAVLCFSYENVNGPITVSSDQMTLPVTPETPDFANWCLYAQPEFSELPGHDVTPLNAILRRRDNLQPPDYQLALQTPSDGAHEAARGTGLSKIHLMHLAELNRPATFETDDGGGCHLGCMCED